MLSINYVSCRPVDCVVGPVTNQYRLLSESLRAQTLPAGLWELLVVDRDNPLPRPELAWCSERVRYVRHRRTPWGEAFAPSIPRNDGLAAARGDVVLGLDDAVSFGPRLLQAVYEYARGGQYLAPVHKRPNDKRAGGPPQTRELCGGLVAYPRELAITTGGHPENFAACYALEDHSFSRRMSAAGCHFVRDPDPELHIITHRTGPTRRPGLARCHYAVDELTQRHPRANTPWTPADLECLCGARCGFFVAPDRCQLLPAEPGKPRKCVYLERPTPEAVAIMRDYEAQPYGLFAP
jgi:hypothetical protein